MLGQTVRSLSDLVLSGIAVGGIIVLALGYLFGTWRRGRNDAARETVGFAVSEVEILKISRTRLEAEVAQQRSDIARLEGTVAQLRTENESLRNLVMMDTIPPALTVALGEIVSGVMADVGAVHTETRRALIEHFDHQLDQNRIYWTEQVADRLHPIEQGVVRLLAEHEGG
jgi:hypothetical protein